MLLPVRHHSPACARLVRGVIARRRPAAVLIEGPSDFNERIGEMFLGHRPPIAIYSYVAWEDGLRQGAYYPMCDYSPEWQALQTARECGAAVRFIDLPFAVLAREDRRVHRYADGRLRGSHYVDALCRALEVEGFDDAWDLLAEQEPDLSEGEVLKRVDRFCRSLRDLDDQAVRDLDRRREVHMAAHVRRAWAEFGRERVVVVTGGYHTSGLEALLAADEADADTAVAWPGGIAERGLALTPYSYERLDSLTGYDAGMPSPGFYHAAWHAAPGEAVHLPLLAAVVHRLRGLKQTASTADLIGVEACAQTLASLRGHARVWRRDLVDAVLAALVKDDLDGTHPFVRTLQEVLRGGERGELAAGSPLPPLVCDVRRRLTDAGLLPGRVAREHALSLGTADGLAKSRLLHRLRVLGIPGFVRAAGVDFVVRKDLSSLAETWRVTWTPEQDAALIEASRYGSALDEAAAACLHEAAQRLERSSSEAALRLLDAVLAGVLNVAGPLRARVAAILHQDGDLASVAQAMNHLLYLFAWDDVLSTRGSVETGALLKTACERAVYLLEAGSPAASAKEEVEAVRLTRDAFERAERPMKLDRAGFAAVLGRVQADAGRTPAQRGACAGALWSLGSADPAHIRRDLRLFAAPEQLGDFLTGLFALAREEAQRDPTLLATIHGLLTGWDDGEFLAALPSLRLAFMYFTPREKAHLAQTLFREETATHTAKSEPVPLAVSPAEAASALAFEVGLWDLASRYGVRLDSPNPSTP